MDRFCGALALCWLVGCAADASEEPSVGEQGGSAGAAATAAPPAPQCPFSDDCTICEAETDDALFSYWTDTMNGQASVKCLAILEPPGLQGTAEYSVGGGKNPTRPCTAGVYSFELLGAGGFARVQNGSTGETVMLICTKQP